MLSFPNNPFVCAGVWDQKEWAEDSKGLGVPIWASVAPKLDRTSMQGTLPLAPTDLVPGTSRAIEAQLQPVCPLWVPGLGSRGRYGAPLLGCLGVPWGLSEAQMLPLGRELATR